MALESKSISMLRFWAAVAVAGALGTALAMDLPAAADRAFITSPAGGGAPRGGFGRRGDDGGAGPPESAAGGLADVWVYLAELMKENEERKAELQEEKALRELRDTEQRQMRSLIRDQQGRIEEQQGQIKNLTVEVSRSAARLLNLTQGVPGVPHDPLAPRRIPPWTLSRTSITHCKPFWDP